MEALLAEGEAAEPALDAGRQISPSVGRPLGREALEVCLAREKRLSNRPAGRVARCRREDRAGRRSWREDRRHGRGAELFELGRP